MNASRRRVWLVAAILAGVAYCVIGRVFAWPTTHARAWRLAAWAASGVVYLVHVAYEQFSLRSSRRALATHVALAVAIGALGLALLGMLHAMSSPAGVGLRWVLAIVLFPAVTAIPAFVVALVLVAALSGMSPKDAPR